MRRCNDDPTWLPAQAPNIPAPHHPGGKVKAICARLAGKAIISGNKKTNAPRPAFFSQGVGERQAVAGRPFIVAEDEYVCRLKLCELLERINISQGICQHKPVR
tara:strand:+ start:514 stop:825 length:312 start_codon:yes stop_codon:yes gene_type:complete